MAGKSTGLAIALLIFGAGNLSAAPLSDTEKARALKLQEEFKSGKIDFCSHLEVDGQKWLVLDVIESTALLFNSQGERLQSRVLDINNLADIAAIKRVVYKDCPSQ